MRRLFIETSLFTRELPKYLKADEYMAFQYDLLKNPQKGSVIKGCGGIRKTRVSVSERLKGKRGGARVIYLDVPDVQWLLLIYIYGKDEKDDMSQNEKKFLKELAIEFKKNAMRKV